MLKKYELSYESFLKIKKYCDKKKIIFLSTPFDIKSADFLRNLVPAFKISSGDNDNYLLLEHITKFNKPIILSLGMTNHKEIYKILKDIRLNKSKLALLHCISEYPTLLKDSQLGVINELKKTGHIIGFSDHTIGYEASLGAICLGAKIIEKHITLNNNMIGPDHKASLNVKHLRDFIDKIRTMENLVKFQKRKITKNEFKTKLIAKKSLFFSGKINKNDKIKKSNLIPMRPFKNGIPISDYKKILNKKTTSEKSKYQQIKLKDIK
jgi:sialic acid synthase SpsE